MYLKQADGSTARLMINGGRHSEDIGVPAKAEGDDRVRTIHFLPTGIDVRNFDGNSLSSKGKRLLRNPTFPGALMLYKAIMNEKNDTMDDVIKLWEEETGLNFDETFPHPGLDACMECFHKGLPCDGAPCRRCIDTGAPRCTFQALPPDRVNVSKYGQLSSTESSATERVESHSRRWHKKTLLKTIRKLLQVSMRFQRKMTMTTSLRNSSAKARVEPLLPSLLVAGG
ncbi:uncharacterized protein RCC_02246 [Ramularia collo-cygni]|uniref:Uncharacterized protein n=1 Tax=Ramularia collo-cygni TaxID=112498 RepID=A0A2D3V7T0_9PEZI|nr:uncharacterized protein RCC_02246 [Ramularia collo-cygni]CZT16403.1 uncharacterized protein RCC_02246 [Ramularia collo-cygni]